MNKYILDQLISCLQILPSEKIVLIKDTHSAFLMDALAKEFSKVEVFDFDTLGRPVTALPETMKIHLQEADCVFYAIDKVAEETALRKEIARLVEDNAVGGRLATMFFPNEELLTSAFSADVIEVKSFTQKLFSLMQSVNELHITCPLGTDLRVKFSSKYNWLVSTGFIERKLARNVLPAEVYTYPSFMEGTLVSSGINGFLSSCKEFSDKKELLRLLKKHPITYQIKNSRIVAVNSSYPLFVKLLEESIFRTDENSSRIGEIGFGTNFGITRLVGILAHDEKFPGVHIAYGNAYATRTGAPYESKVHSDTVLINATVKNTSTGECILKDGKYVF